MSREPRLYLQDILESSKKAVAYTDDMTFEAFCRDDKTIDAVVRNFEIIGEAVKHVSPELLSIAPEIEWRQAARLRDVVIHQYFKVKLTIVWDIARNRMPEFGPAVVKILDSLPEPTE